MNLDPSAIDPGPPVGLAGDLERIREEERIRIARAIHDELGQALTGLKMDLSWVRRRLPEACAGEHFAAFMQKIEGMISLTDGAIVAVRRIATELRPVLLDELGLGPAIELQAQEFEQRSGIPCLLTLDDLAFKGDGATALFRILREALTNVIRHAGATVVHVALRHRGDTVTLEVIDNGKGIPEAALGDRRALGLMGMRERAALVGGALMIERLPGHGTRVEARVPFVDECKRWLSNGPVQEDRR